MKKILFFTIVLIGTFSNTLYSQGAEICNSSAKTDLITEINSNENFILTPKYDSQLWSSSFLKADGVKPECLPENNCNSDENDAKYSCKYSARSAQDNNTKTAWAEGVDGDGENEILLARVDFSKPIKIFAGLGLNKNLFLANNRPKEIRVYIIEIGNIDDKSQIPTYQKLKIKGTHNVELKDLFGFQNLNIPKYTLKKNNIGNKHIIGIEILSVYKGTKYSDTLISEVTN
jgi:hypothetical protein